MAQIVCYCIVAVDKELALGFEIAKLEDEVGLGGNGMDRFDSRSLGCAQVEIELPVFLGESRQPV
jgi:hypothetical protein